MLGNASLESGLGLEVRDRLFYPTVFFCWPGHLLKQFEANPGPTATTPTPCFCDRLAYTFWEPPQRFSECDHHKPRGTDGLNLAHGPSV